jgi:outer membrane biosynthesis protein TonB
MVPQTQKRKPRNSSKVNLIISLTFHGVLLLALLYFAAREGLLGKQIKKIAVEMVKEKPPEKPKEPEKPKQEIPKPELPKTVQAAPKVETPRDVVPPPPTGSAPPAAAPAAVDNASFVFEGKAVDTESDPVQLYKGLLEFSLRSRWDRPEDIEDGAFVAEVELSVDRSGRISDPVWKKGSGDKRWDDSVRQALARTPSMAKAPPPNFPPHVVVRFDVTAAEPILPQ